MTDAEITAADHLASWCDDADTWPLPGGGETARRFQLLSSICQADLVLGRLVEAHADAVAITAELGAPAVQRGQRWGVWAAGPAGTLRASRIRGRWRIDGTKNWCSGATLLTHALVDASTDAGQQLFSVDLRHSGIEACPPTWVGPGMARADTRSVSFDNAAGSPVGRPDEYLSRPGFWAGAIGVAACWHGGTVTVAAALITRSRSSEDPHLLVHLGATYVALEQNRAMLRSAAEHVDGRPSDDHSLTALATRNTVERNAGEVVDRVGRALGPGPLALDRLHAAAVADLSVYVRQHHAERDLESIGRNVSQMEDPWSS